MTQTEKSNSELSDIDLSLNRIANCLAFMLLNSDKLKGRSNNDLIPFFASLGFEKEAIATILQTTTETVRVRLAQLKKLEKQL
jgi:hypothetical protein